MSTSDVGKNERSRSKVFSTYWNLNGELEKSKIKELEVLLLQIDPWDGLNLETLRKHSPNLPL